MKFTERSEGFSDDDLKLLKERALTHDFSRNGLMSIEIFRDLLARLEAAENLAEYAVADEHADDCGPTFGCRKEATKAWCKAKGE